MRRFALISDVHGNIAALDAVLGDIDAHGPAELYCLGDLVGYGPEPGAVIARIRERGIPTVLGNYDEGVGNDTGSCGCYYATEEARSDGEASYEFTARVLSGADKEWLAGLPREIRFDAEGARVLLAHGSPRRINEYLLPDRSDEQLLRLAEQAEADVVCVGHVHVPYHRQIDAPSGAVVHYVSAGAAGRPKDGDPRACWVEVAIASGGSVETRVHRVAYDVGAVAEAVVAAGLPGRLADALRTA